MTFFQTRKRKGPPEALLKIIFGRRYIKPQIHVDLFRTRISERSAGGFAQIHLGQQYLRLRWALTLSTHKRRKGPLEVVPKFILGRNILASYRHLTLSKHKIWKDPPEALPKFILGRDDLSLKSVFDFFQTIKMEKSAGGSAQVLFRAAILWPQIGMDSFHSQKMEKSAGGSAHIYLGQKYLSLKSIFDFSKL